MNPREQGFLLLTSPLGDLERKVLTTAQLRNLAKRVRQMVPPEEQRQLCQEDLMAVGCTPEQAEQILGLLSQEQKLKHYVSQGKQRDCYPVTRVTPAYPVRLRRRLGEDSPGCLWAKGDISLLRMPMVALIGSRDLRQPNEVFALEAGKQAALQGYALLSGNARGADRTAQEACLAHGGKVVSVVADRLESHPQREGVLYLSEDGYDLDFTAQRALSRNRVIHCLGLLVLVAQCTPGKGGTWSGAQSNLRRHWGPLFCFSDGSTGAQELFRLGAEPIDINALADLEQLISDTQCLFDR